MRAMRLISAPVFLLFALSLQAQKNLSLLPEQPKPGQTIQIRYNPSGTELLGMQDISAIAYLVANRNLPAAHEIQLTKEGNEYIGSIATNDSTSAVFVRFLGGGKTDNNNQAGYYTLLYGNDGKPVQGAALAAANCFSTFSNMVGLKPNSELQTKFIRQEYSAYPSSKKQYRFEYLYALSQLKEDADKEELKKELDLLAADPNATDAELTQAKWQYERILKDKDKAAAIDKLRKERFPNGSWLKGEKVNAFFEETDAAKKDSLYQALVKQFPPAGAQEQSNYDYFASQVVTAYGLEGKYEKMWESAALIKNKSSLAGAYNFIAWKLAGEGIHGKPGDIKLGKEISAKSLELIKEHMATDKDQKPVFMTEKQWKHEQEGNYYMYADTYATLLYHNKEYEKAIDLEKSAAEFFKYNDLSMNETYSALLEKTKGAKAAQKELETFVKDGKASAKMKDQLKRIYLAQNHSEAQWMSYAANLEKEQLEKTRQELVKEMMNTPAPQFKLKDLGGNEVSLASLKGKTVVVDFWATWCGPCVASFPGMQKAVNKYKNDPNVVFLFIDTWESGADREKRVKNFIAKNKYSFKVLYDETAKDSPDEFVVVNNYKVEGIPTKFVIDKNSNIRFKTVGYSGSADLLVAEISMMIEMANADAKTGTATEKRGF